ncbi:MAG: 50S ribosomal protein L12 [Nitrosopumilus sp.]|nr:50S ribosomal protein L12 [Nitrosopumilus sp.]
MEYVYAALLLHKLKKDVNEANISSVVKASGTEVNEAQVKSLVAALADVNIDDAVKAAPVAVQQQMHQQQMHQQQPVVTQRKRKNLKQMVNPKKQPWKDCLLCLAR